MRGAHFISVIHVSVALITADDHTVQHNYLVKILEIQYVFAFTSKRRSSLNINNCQTVN